MFGLLPDVELGYRSVIAHVRDASPDLTARSLGIEIRLAIGVS